jgi:(1->4)-alpha-D-glucan 1-alpha-D-glucosylmutase
MDELLSAQPYRLSYWRVAAEEINYRRFFDVNELAAIRVENLVVFDTIHRLLLELVKQESVTGIRIDHVDGLRDPKQYLTTLQERCAAIYGSDNGERATYLIVEKILSEDEKLRSDWPIYGTTGYEFVSDLTQLLVDPANEGAFSKIYREFIDRYVHLESLIYEKKKLVMDVSLASDIECLGLALSELAERDRLHRDFTLDSLRTVVREVIACFPVYRTYVSEESGASESDRQVVLRAVRAAKRRNAAMDVSIFDFLRDVLLLERFSNFNEEARRLHLEFVLKFQQCTGPIMAKGLEDTAFYIFNRLAALNEVGSNPRQFGMSAERFHQKNRARLTETPHSLLASTSHDTKRSEDARARIAVLSEIPDQWRDWIDEWRETNNDCKTEIDGEQAPSANEEYLFYQTVLGTYPFSLDAIDGAYIERMQRYMLKAIKEAKVNSSWIQPNESWENAATQFVAKTLDAKHAFLPKLDSAATKVAWHGALNSLSQLVLKLTVPGVPDFYQGTELWDFSLVDPDNRRPVDYGQRQQLLSEIETVSADKLFSSWQDGRIKMFVTARLLQLRHQMPGLFREGNYSSIYATGELADCCVAFSRELNSKKILVVVPRYTTRLGEANSDFDWKNTELVIHETIPAMHELFTGMTLKAGIDALPLKELKRFPVAVFYSK